MRWVIVLLVLAGCGGKPQVEESPDLREIWSGDLVGEMDGELVAEPMAGLTLSCARLEGEEGRGLVAGWFESGDLPLWARDLEVELVGGEGRVNLAIRYGAGIFPMALHEAGTLSALGFGEDASCPAAAPRDLIPAAGPEAQGTWSRGSVVQVTGDLTIPQGKSLTIEPGVAVVLGPGVNIIAEGSIFSLGTREEPVVFQATGPESSWGGIEHQGSEGRYQWTFFTRGGGDGSRTFGHSDSQPVLLVRDGSLSLERVVMFDNPGKALGAENGSVEVARSIISRCDTGGELKYSRASLTDSHFLDMPSDSPEPGDEDNDGIYLAGTMIDEEGQAVLSRVSGCVFARGWDDGIDHNGATLEIRDSFIADFFHEGVACSNKGSATISNTLVKGCEQGIEAGYGSPQVRVEHCLLIGNRVGLRVGDSYDWEVGGHLDVRSSISWGNTVDNVLNFVNKLQGPLVGGLEISASLVADPDWDGAWGNISGDPVFDGFMRLEADSPGVGRGEDGSDPGLLPFSAGAR